MLRTERYLRLIAACLFLAFGAYSAAFILQKSIDTTVTEKAEYRVVSESFSVRGKASRRLIPINAVGSGYIILAAEGEYLSGGSAVAVREDSADAYFAFLDYELGKISFDSEKDAVLALKSGDTVRRIRAALYFEGQKPPDFVPCPEGVIYAPCAGVFTRTGGSIGAIASEVNWFFSFKTEKSRHLSRGQKLNLKISSRPCTDAEVYSIDEDKTVLIVRSCEDFIPQKERYDAKICLSDCSGIEVPHGAMHFDADGSAFVYVLSAGIKEKTAVRIIYTSPEFFLCEPGSVREGMEILISEN